MPLLLAGKYWLAQNGILLAPTFTPAFCGGVPLLANPQSIFYSLPQALASFVGPIDAFMITTVIAAFVGSGGTYVLLRRDFRASTPAALLGAVLFLFNGFLVHRMMIGHVTFHTFGLIPVAAIVLLSNRQSPTGGAVSAISAVTVTALIVAYVIYAGAVNILVPFGIAVVMIWLLHAIILEPVRSFWFRGISGGLLGIALGAMKLAPAVAFVAAFPRPEPLHLMEFPELVGSLGKGFFAAFLTPEPGRQEFEFGIGPVPLIAIVWFRFLVDPGRRLARRFRERLARSWKLVAALCGLLLIPVLINYDGPGFQPFLQALPYIGNNVRLSRWWFVYIPLAVVASAVIFDRIISDPRRRNILASGGMLVTALYAVAVDHGYYENQPYDPSEIVLADTRLRLDESVPAISAIGGDENGIAAGVSRFPCYEPMFGYQAQNFPGELRTGRLRDGATLRNPACYIYGKANGCTPGDALPSGSAAEAAFAAYRPFPYIVPGWQRAADAVTLAALGLVAAALLQASWCAARRWRRALRPASGGDDRL